MEPRESQVAGTKLGDGTESLESEEVHLKPARKPPSSPLDLGHTRVKEGEREKVVREGEREMGIGDELGHSLDSAERERGGKGERKGGELGAQGRGARSMKTRASGAGSEAEVLALGLEKSRRLGAESAARAARGRETGRPRAAAGSQGLSWGRDGASGSRGLDASMLQSPTWGGMQHRGRCWELRSSRGGSGRHRDGARSLDSGLLTWSLEPEAACGREPTGMGGEEETEPKPWPELGEDGGRHGRSVRLQKWPRGRSGVGDLRGRSRDQRGREL